MTSLVHKTYKSGKLLHKNGAVADSTLGNVESSRVYVFGNHDDSDDEITEYESHELSGMRSRGSGKQTSKKNKNETKEPEDNFIEKDIVEGDTLQNIALKFGCPVSEIKRINNLISDQDFYALKKIKVPVKRHGLLTELMEQEKTASNYDCEAVELDDDSMPYCAISRTSEPNTCDESDDESENKRLLVRTISISGALRGQSREASDFLKKMDNDIKNIVQSSRSRMDSLEEVTESLTSKRIQPFQKDGKWLKMNGTDCGMQWWSVVVVMFVIGLITPILFGMYYYYYLKPDGHGR